MISLPPTIEKAAAALRNGTLTPAILLEGCLDRIRRFDSRVRAWVVVDESGARSEAERLGVLARRGEWLGPLHGIPVGVKDIFDVAGFPTGCGSPLRQGNIAREDAVTVASLRRAGTIILGKTVTTEFASFDPPPTRNPWNLERTPGGSSSGSAAAVALHMCYAALGSQTGGSIVRPASYCGVVGYKPTYGWLSLSGIEPLSWHMDHPGPITRSARDASLLMEVLGKGTPAPAPLQTRPRFVVAPGFFLDRADPAMRAVFDTALGRLQEAGLSVETLSALPADFDDILVSHRRIMAVDAASHHLKAFQESSNQFGPKIASLIAEGLPVSAVDYEQALRHQSRVREQLLPLFAEQRILLTPAATSPAPPRDSTGDPSFNAPWSFAGVPSLTIPAGLSSDRLPCGLQLVGAADSDWLVLAAGASCEAALKFPEVPPLSLET